MTNAAVIGLGWWGQNILKNLLDSEVIRPVLGVDPLDSARASAAALGVETASRFEDALANPKVEAVILSTPQERHAGQIVAAAKAGRHVFCEKPLCTTAADARAESRGSTPSTGLMTSLSSRFLRMFCPHQPRPMTAALIMRGFLIPDYYFVLGPWFCAKG